MKTKLRCVIVSSATNSWTCESDWTSDIIFLKRCDFFITSFDFRNLTWSFTHKFLPLLLRLHEEVPTYTLRVQAFRLLMVTEYFHSALLTDTLIFLLRLDSVASVLIFGVLWAYSLCVQSKYVMQIILKQIYQILFSTVCAWHLMIQRILTMPLINIINLQYWSFTTQFYIFFHLNNLSKCIRTKTLETIILSCVQTLFILHIIPKLNTKEGGGEFCWKCD